MADPKILIIQFKQRGDILLTVPVARRLKAVYPQSEIHFMTFKMGEALLRGMPFIDKVVVLDYQKSLLASIKCLKFVFQQKYDLVLDFMNNPRSTLFSIVSLASRRLAFSSIRKVFYSDIIDHPLEACYVVQQKFQFLDRLGITYGPDDLRLSIFNSAEDMALANEFFEKANLLSANRAQQIPRPIVALSPTHGRLTRRWGGENFIKLAQQLIDNYQASIIWLWGPGEFSFVKKLGEKLGKGSVLIPAASISQLSAILSRCDVFIGNSNGPSHIAVANGILTIEIHGATNPKNWTHPDTTKHRYVASSRSCQGCNSNWCKEGNVSCMKDVTVAHVLREFDELWVI